MKSRAVAILFTIMINTCCYHALFGQSEIDSLKALLEDNPNDTIRIDVYIALHQRLVDYDTVQSLAYLQNAISLSEENNNTNRLANGYLTRSFYYWNKGQLQNARKALIKVEELLPVVSNIKIEGSFYNYQGLVNFGEGNYEEGVDFFIKALSIFETIGDIEGAAKCYNNIGSIYFELDKLDDALKSYQRALTLLNDNYQEEKIGRFLGNIGLVYRAKGDYQKALEYYKRSLEINEKYGYEKDAAINLQNIAVLYTKMENYPEALQHMLSSNEISRKIDDKIGILYSSHGLASIYGKMGQSDKSIDELEKVLILAKNLNLKEEIKNIYESLSNYYEETKQFDLALKNRKYYESWKDSLINENHLNQVKELEIKYETAQKDNQISELAYQNELQAKETQRQSTIKKAFIGGFILTTLLAGLIIYITRQRLKNQKLLAEKDKEIKEVNFRQQLSELEMKALRAQINPHFLYNCMNSINRMILEKENEMASQYLAKFSKLVRLILENAEKPSVPLQNELAMLEAYINLEGLRFKGKIKYAISVDESVDPDTTYLPSMVLQPFVENAIWHGLMNKNDDEEGLIKISVKEENEILNCAIEDNGIGREAALELREKSILKTKSMGMKITEERLKLIAKEGWERLINIVDLKDHTNQPLGTRVEITLPLQNQT